MKLVRLIEMMYIHEKHNSDAIQKINLLEQASKNTNGMIPIFKVGKI